ncbi:hypothetical protein LZ023_38205 (plasmid) [Pseudomonas silvicola]|nr:hypothetical protein LZ023_38205 [Pseudomonas silvicola]
MVDYLDDANDVAEVEQRMSSVAYDAVISRTVELNAKAINACPTLKIICKHGVGVTNIDVVAATERGIPVLTTPATNAQSVAELTLALMLNCAPSAFYFQQEVAAGRWTRSGDGKNYRAKPGSDRLWRNRPPRDMKPRSADWDAGRIFRSRCSG